MTIRFGQNLYRLIAGKEIAKEDVVADALEAAKEEENKEGGAE